MSIPSFIVQSAKQGWKWQWNQLMNGLAPADQKGNYIRPDTKQKNNPLLSGNELKQREQSQLPILIIGKSCPWAHRCWLVYKLKNLDPSMRIYLAKVDSEKGKWILDPPIMGCSSLQELYKACNAPAHFRATVPLLLDPGQSKKHPPRIISNESIELVKILNEWPLNGGNLNLYPIKLKKVIDYWEPIIHKKINNGVYLCGFARNQKAYEYACNELNNSLESIEKTLSLEGPWICGEEITILDVFLFTTLIRWEIIYAPLFKCSKKPLNFFPNIIRWRKSFFNKTKDISTTCDSNSWRKDYFGALFPLNPSNIVPLSEDIDRIINYEAH